MSASEQSSVGLIRRSELYGNSPDSTDVKVVVRVRPQTLDMELQPGVHTCVEVEGYNVCTVRSPHESLTMPFNWVAGPATTQSEFFKVVGRPTVENCLSGFNSSIFAYGQTGSGKTYTMIGELPADGTGSLPSDAGIIPRIFKYLWQRMPEVQAGLLANPGSSCGSLHSSISSVAFGDMRRSLQGDEAGRGPEQPSLKWLVRCSMLEIHKEDIYDLLRPGNGPLNIREDIRKGVYVEGLCERVVEEVSDALDVLRAGVVNRQVAANELNAASSRSHCIFTCHIESRLELQAGMVNVRSSRLHLVDLAGSERLKTSWASALAGSTATSVSSSYDGGSLGGSGATGASSNLRLRETTSINSSLTVLGLVILRLTEQQPHIPYRNSKLTFLLQDSIGGNAKTVIVANISPSEACVQETLSTLGFAARARKIVNKAIVNEDHNDDASMLRQKVRRLQQELALARALAAKVSPRPSMNDNSLAAAAADTQAAGAASQQLFEHGQQLEQALEMLSDLGKRNKELEEAAEFYQWERNVLEQNCLNARQELAAMQVSLQQAMSENKSWRHRWFKPDKHGKAAQAQQQQQQGKANLGDKGPAAGPFAAEGSAGSTSSKAQQPQGGSGWSFSSMFGKKDKARAAAAAAAAAATASNAADETAVAEADHGAQDGAECQRHEEQQQPAYQEQQEPQQQLQHVLQLIGDQLGELAVSICQNAGQAAPTLQAAAAGSVPAGMPRTQAAAAEPIQLQAPKLQHLEELQRHQEGIPELQATVSALQTMVAWALQQQQQQQGLLQKLQLPQQQQQEQANPLPTADVPPSSPCKASASKVAPSELHRQLFEERQLTAQLQARIRQLQQELLLAGGPAVAATVSIATSAAATHTPTKQPTTAARLARLSPGVGVHYSADAVCTKALHVAPTELDAAFAKVATPRAGRTVVPAADVLQAHAEQAVDQAVQADTAALTLQAEPVVVQIRITSDESKAVQQPQAEAEAQTEEGSSLQAVYEQPQSSSAAEEQQQLIEALKAEVAELREQLDSVQRERANFHSRLQSARSVLAAARCSTPSSLLSSGLVSPQPSFGVLQPVFGDSIIEEPEEDELQLESSGPEVLLGSLSSWHPEPEAAASPVGSNTCRPATCTTDTSECDVGSGLDEDLSQAEVWQQHHSQVQQYQQEYDRVEQLTKAVHAALTAANHMGYSPWSPEQPTQQQQQQQQDVSGIARHAGQDNPQQQLWLQEQELPGSIQWQAVEAACLGSSEGDSSTNTTRSSHSTRGSSLSGSLSGDALPTLGMGQLSSLQTLDQAAHSADAQLPPADHVSVGSHSTARDTAAATAEVPQESPVGADEGSWQHQSVQTDEQWPSAPLWSVADYEEEVRQLSEQLQGLVGNNSSLKALLQQRDTELAAQQERLEQQGHDLACCEDMLQELQDRLAASEAAAAASAAEHCDAMWAKGQVQGLMELNEVLQEQLETQGQELDMRAQEVEELRAALSRCTNHGVQTSPQQTASPCGTEAAAAAVQQEASTQAADPAALPPITTAGVSTGAATGNTAQHFASAAEGGQLLPGVDVAVSSEAGLDQECRTPRGPLGLAAGQQASPASCTSGSKRRRKLQAHRDITRTAGAAAAFDGSPGQPMSPFKQLRMQTHQLRSEPHNSQVVTEQAVLLRQQQAAVGLHLRRAQLEAELTNIKLQLQHLYQKQQRSALLVGCSSDTTSVQGSPALTEVDFYPSAQQQQQQPQSPTRPSLLSRHTHGLHSLGEEQLADVGARDAAAAATPQACDDVAQAAAGSVAQASSSSAVLLRLADAVSGAREAADNTNSASVSTASSPRSGGSSSEAEDCADLLADLVQDLHTLAAASHQASTFKAVSAGTLSPLWPNTQQQQQVRCEITAYTGQAELQAAAGSRRPGSGNSPGGAELHLAEYTAASPRQGLAPSPELSAAPWASDAALKLQCDLQVSSAYELAAARGLLHASAVAQELQSTLAGSKHAHHRHHKHGSEVLTAMVPAHSSGNTPTSSKPLQLQGALQHQQQAAAQGEQSPPVARSLLRNFEGASPSIPPAEPGRVDGGAVAAVVDTSRSPQEGFSVLRQLQQQQQYIIQVLGSLAAKQQQQQAAGGSPATTQLQQLADAQEQLQVLLHAASGAMQLTYTAHDPQQLLGQTEGSQQGPGRWPAAAAGLDAAGRSPSSSPARQYRKHQDQQQQDNSPGQPTLQGGSPDQQQLRDSSPEKLWRSQKSLLAGCQPAAAVAAAGRELSSLQGVSQQQQAQHEVDKQLQELTQLRGQVIRLQLELQQAKLQQQAQASASTATNAHSSYSGRRSTTPDHAWMQRSQESVGTPAAAAVSASGACTASSTVGTAASSSSAGTPTQMVLLSGKNRELQALCQQREHQVKLLEGEVRRLQLELRHQAVAAAPALTGGVASTAGGALTPRSAVGALTPRQNLPGIASSSPSIFSPQRRAVSSPGTSTGTPRPLSSAMMYGGLAAQAAGSYAGHLAAQQLQQQQPHLPVTRFYPSSGGSTAHGTYSSHSDVQSWLAPQAAGEAKAGGGTQRELLLKEQQQSAPNVLLRTSLDEASCASTSSSKSRGKGVRVGSGKPPLHVASFKRLR